MNEHLTAIFVLVLSSLVLSQEQAPLVTIPDGQIKGTSGLTGVESRIFYAYRGIPFAKPPLGDLRFAAPVKNDPWNDILDATKDQEQCVQKEIFHEVVGSEDCLYINVYTTHVNGNLPVMVWIHGGAFVSGSSKPQESAPDNFLEKDVIFVSFNYRLGILGFLSTEDESAPGNWGIKDQIMALRWVKDNIQYFGGDPNRITIFGESAGGASVSYLTQTNMTTGLFNGAIMQSGTSLCLWALSRNAREIAFSLGSVLRISTESSKSLIRDLRKQDYRNLTAYQNIIAESTAANRNILAGLPFGVVTEPDIPGAVFSKKSWQLLSTGQFQRVPSIVGYNSNEAANLQKYMLLVRPLLFQYLGLVSQFAPFDLTKNPLKRPDAGADIRPHYFGDIAVLFAGSKALSRFVNVDQFNRPIREYVNQVSKFIPVYYYQFSYSGLLGDPNQTHEGVGHAEELPYLFYSKTNVTSQSDFITSQRIVTLWTNFAKTGNPTPWNDPESDNLLGGISWEANDPTTNTADSIKYLNINNSLTMESNPFQADWEYYQRIYDKFGDPPYATY